MNLSCFKAYDVRGVVPDTLNEEIARRIGRAFALEIDPGRVVLGHDIRLTSPALASALSEGLRDGGVDVFDIGLCGTEEIYFATAHHGMGGGIMVTASHNPMDYNGIKFVREHSRPVSGDTGLVAIRERAESGEFPDAGRRGTLEKLDARPAYIQHLLSYVDRDHLKPLRIAMDAGNGGAGMVVRELAHHLPFEIIEVNFEPDGRFPNGIPNPLLPERRAACIDAVRAHGADLGVAWDGDFDRCFLFDEQGNFIEGYYIVGLLAEAFLRKSPGARIVYDPRLTWNTIETVHHAGGVPVQSKAGHSFIKEEMRAEDAVYGGEMSAHHYFRDFFYCDSGMIPWLLITELLSAADEPLSGLVAERVAAYPCSGEINFMVSNIAQTLSRVREIHEPLALRVDETDGIGFEMENWRFNLRASNTEPVIRLNVETRADPALLRDKVEALSGLISEA
jgi:phosphomannomutase